MRRRWLAAGSVVVAFGFAGLLVACTSTVSPRSQPKVPAFSSQAAPSSAPATAPPKTCKSVGQASDIDIIVGHPLTGSMNQVVGVPMPKIKRTGRLDCYYGIPAGKPVTSAVLTIAIASYTDAASAAHRMTLTVNNARDAGANISDVRAGSDDAVLVNTAKNQELVLTTGDLTVLVSASNGVLTNGKAGQQLAQLAQRALAAGN